MNPSKLNELIDTIRSLLDGSPTSVAPATVAQEYARNCREVNERFARIGLMLAEGGEIQALQLAEQSPRVLDLAIGLSFGREGEWLEYCRNQNFEVAPVIDARTLDDLLEIQAKGVAPNHPLYRDYRAAVSSKNESKAFELIRVIHRLNPDDENAAREFKRLRRKQLTEVLGGIRDAHANADHQAVLSAMPKVEECGDPEEYEKLPEWREALAIRHRQRSDEARLRMPTLLENAQEQLRLGDWRAAALAHGEFTQLSEAFGTDGQAPGIIEQVKRLDGQLSHHRAEANRVAKAERLESELLQLAKGVEARAASTGLDPEFAAPLLMEIAFKSKQIADLHGEVPEPSRVSIEAARGMLSATIEGARSSRRRKKVAVIAMVATLVLATTGYAIAHNLASQSTQSLADLRAKQATAGLREVLNRLDGKEAVLLKFSALSTEAAEARQWLAKVDADSKGADQEILRLEKVREANFAGLSPTELQQKLDEVETMAAKLPEYQRQPAEARILVVRNDAVRDWKRRQAEADQKAGKVLDHWTLLLEKVDYETSVDVAKAAIKGYQADFVPLLPLAAQPDTKQALMRLPPATATRVNHASDALAEVANQVAKVETALAALEKASQPDDYRTALTALAGCRFKEAALAKVALNNWPADEKLRAFLVFRNDLDAFRDAANGDSPFPDDPHPENATKQDREIIGELMEADTLNDLWEVVWRKKDKPVETWFGKGPLKDAGKNWSGKVSRPITHPSEKFKFAQQTFGENNGVTLKSNRILAVSEMMSQLQLSSLLDDTGTEYRRSVLPMVDRVTNAKNVSPLARAFVLARLFKLIRAKEIAWGAHYCPELLDDMNQFIELETKWPPVVNGVWLITEKPIYAKYWEGYFVGRENRSSYDNMKKMKSAAHSGINNPLTLAGRVGLDGGVKLETTDTSRLLIGIGEVKPRKVEVCIAGIQKTDPATDLAPTVPLVPFSPVLYIDLSEADLRFLQALHAKDLSQPPTTKTP